MQVKRVKIETLTRAAHNPKDRVKKGNARLRQLQTSIERFGLIYPIAISKAGDVIDGHRRLQACINLGWEDIPALIVESDDADAVYADVNANSQHLTGGQNLSVWLNNPRAVTSRTANTFAKWENVVGRSVMSRICKAGMSIRILRTAKRTADYVGAEDPEFITTIALWLLKHRNARLIESYILMQQPPAKLYRAIKAGRALTSTFA